MITNFSPPPPALEPPLHFSRTPHVYSQKKKNKVASCGDDSNVRVSDLRSRSSFGVSHRLDGVHDGPCHTVRWHPFDANILLSAGLDSTIKLHDLRSLGAPLHVFRGHCPYALARRVVYGTRRRRQRPILPGARFLFC